MNSSLNLIGSLLLGAALSLGAFAQTPAPAQSAKPAKPAKAAKPTADADIEACIKQKLTAAPKLKSESFTVAVSGGVATFTGATKNAGSKGGVFGIAKSCGAKQIVNNITVEKALKAAKPAKAAPATTKQ
jgi:osmotically-inducible protein OsmY